MIVPTVFVETASVERLLTAAAVAVGPESMAVWLAGPMTESVQQRAQERFLTQGDEVSGNWASLREATLQFRAEQGFGPTPINVRTGELERYITESNSRVTPTGVGASMVYPGEGPSSPILDEKVRTAQAGKPANPGQQHSTPARPVLGLGVADLEYALMSMTAWITTSIQAGRL